jgi:hypothetical protein
MSEHALAEESPVIGDARDGSAHRSDTESAAGAVVGVFDTHAQARHAIRYLASGGFPLRRLSIVGKGYHTEERPTGFYRTRDRVKTSSGLGLFWGSIWGLFFGTAFFWVPGVGPAEDAWPILHLLLAAALGALAVGLAGALGAALFSLVLPKREGIKYDRFIGADRFLVIARGTPMEVEKAGYLMEQEQAAETAVVDAPVDD